MPRSALLVGLIGFVSLLAVRYPHRERIVVSRPQDAAREPSCATQGADRASRPGLRGILIIIVAGMVSACAPYTLVILGRCE